MTTEQAWAVVRHQVPRFEARVGSLTGLGVQQRA